MLILGSWLHVIKTLILHLRNEISNRYLEVLGVEINIITGDRMYKGCCEKQEGGILRLRNEEGLALHNICGLFCKREYAKIIMVNGRLSSSVLAMKI
jgi:hypothetical protein